MRPVLLAWLVAAAAATAALAAETPPPTTASTAATTTPAPPTTGAALAPTPAADSDPPPAPVHGSTPLAQLLFPQAVGQVRSSDGEAATTMAGGAADTVPWLASFARSFPVQLRAFDKPAQSREAVSAIEEFTGPLVRFATGGQPVAADVEQLIDSIPHLARSANAMKEAAHVNLSSVDTSSFPPNVISYVLNGGEIPGIPRAELDRVIQEHFKKMSEAAARVAKGEHVENIEKILPPLNKVPMEMVMTSLQGKTLPGLSADETAKIREYYTKQLPSNLPMSEAAAEHQAAPLPDSLATLGNMAKMLPLGYDIGKIPPKFIESILAGQVPNLELLPVDLQNYLKGGTMSLVRTLNSSITDILQQLQKRVAKMPQSSMKAAEAYDISKVTHEVVDAEALKDTHNRNILYTVTWISAAIVVATIVISCLLYRMFASPTRKAPLDSRTPPARFDADGWPLGLHSDDSPAFQAAFAADAAAAGDMISPGGTIRRRQGLVAKAIVARAARFSTPKTVLPLHLQIEQELERALAKKEPPSDSIDDGSYLDFSWNFESPTPSQK